MTDLKDILSRRRHCDSWNECHAELLGAPVEVVRHPLAVALLLVVLALIGVFLAFGEHGVDESGQFVSCGGDGFGLVHA